METLTRCNLCSATALESFDAEADLCRCSRCGFTFVSPRPTVQELIAYYSAPGKYDEWLAELEARDLLWRRRLAKMDRVKRAGSLLDVGTGIGQFLNLARSHFTEVYGTEVSEAAIDIAKSRFGLDIFRGQVEHIEFGRTFDNVSLFHVLEHVPDPKALVARCWSLLNPGGMIFIAVPNDLLSLQLKILTFIGRLRRRSRGARSRPTGRFGIPKILLDGTVDEIHLSQFTPKTLDYLLRQQGFAMIENSLDPFFAKLGRKLLLHQIHYRLHGVLSRLSGVNRYNTIWAAARRMK